MVSTVTNQVIAKMKLTEEIWQKKCTEKSNFDVVCFFCGRKWHRSFECRPQKICYEEKNEKAKKATDGEDNDLVFCSLTMDN